MLFKGIIENVATEHNLFKRILILLIKGQIYNQISNAIKVVFAFLYNAGI